MKCVGGQRRRAGALGHRAQLPRAPEVHADRSEQHQHRPERSGAAPPRGSTMRSHRLPDDPGAGDRHQAGFAKGGDVLEFAVAVGVVFVGGLVAHLHGEESERRAGQVQPGVGRIGEHAQRAGKQPRGQLQQRHCRRREHGVQRHPPLLRGVTGHGWTRAELMRSHAYYAAASRGVQPGDAEGVRLPCALFVAGRAHQSPASAPAAENCPPMPANSCTVRLLPQISRPMAGSTRRK